MSAARTLRLITFFCFLILLVLTLPPVLSFEQADMPQRGAMISPSAKSTGAGAEFFVDVVVYPFIEGRTSPTSQLINNYQLAVGYNQNDLTFPILKVLVHSTLKVLPATLLQTISIFRQLLLHGSISSLKKKLPLR